MVRSGYSLVAVEVKVQKDNKTLNVSSLGKPLSFVFPRVLGVLKWPFARVTKEVYFVSADMQDYFVTPCVKDI